MMRVRQHIVVSAGMLDAGLASLASLAVGLFAARSLEPSVLGTYALVFTAFLLMTKIPAQLVFTPAEVIAIEQPPAQRLILLRQSLRLGLLPALGSAIGVSVWMLFAPATVLSTHALPFTITAIVSAFVSPLQDHVRRMLHIGSASWWAAGVSALHLLFVVLALWSFTSAKVPVSWVPFMALAVANLSSMLFGLAASEGRKRHDHPPIVLRYRDLRRSGRWLVAVGLIPAVAGLAVAALVSRMIGSAALGYAEAARVVGQPPFVLSAGLSAVLGPRAVRAAREGQLEVARSISRTFVALMLLTGIPYFLVVSAPGWWNPLPRLIPNAYTMSGLAALTVLAYIANGIALPFQFQMLGAKRERSLTEVEAVGNLVRIGVAGAALPLGAFSVPLALLVLGLVRWLWYVRILSSYFGRAAERVQSKRLPDSRELPVSSSGLLPPT